MTLSVLPADNVQAYVPGDRRRALAAGVELPEQVRGAGLFADISGFTPLTEALAAELGGERGAEELTAALESVFGALLDTVDRFGGEAIYFSGDAVTCWLDGDDGLRATACGLQLQEVMARVGRRRTPAGRDVTLRLKVAVAAGQARRFVVGDPQVQLLDVLAGRVVDALAAAEATAAPGDVVVEPATAAALAGRVALRGAAVERLLVDVPTPAQPPAPPELPPDQVRPWLLPAVYDRLVAGRGEFLADLRPAVPLFLRFGGLDFDGDPSARDDLDALVVQAQRVVRASGGSVLQLTLGDKGAYLYAVFGAPVAHEDDAARACSAALDLLALEGSTRATGLTVGVSTGRLRSGTYGSAQRRTFCCLGDAVNLAARLMTAAPPGQAWVSEEVRRLAGSGFAWRDLPRLQVKGKALPVTVSAVTGRSTGRRAAPEGPMLGRDPELARLLAAADLATTGRGQVVCLTAEAGLGKSRLVAALAEALAERGATLHTGSTVAFGGQGGYDVWRDVVRSALGLRADDPPAQAAGRLRALVEAAAPDLLPRVPLLGTLLGLELPDSPLTATFDAELRKASLEALVVQLLTARGQGLLALALEDLHWVDPLSADLLRAVLRAVPRLPLLVVLSRRPRSGAEPDPLEGAAYDDLVLGELDAGTTLQLARARVQERTGHGADEVAPAVLDRLVARAQGNPFHLEELLGHLLDQGVDLRTADPGGLDLPDTLQRLVLTRVDGLPEQPRRTLKVASVVGRRFGTEVLAGAYPDLGDDDDVEGHLSTLTQSALVLPEGAPHAYAFRHGMTEEVAYGSLPFAMRGMLHDRVGRWLEQAAPEGSTAVLDQLAHHASLGTDDDRKRDLLPRAGLAAQRRYANSAAVALYRRALEVVRRDDRAELLERLGTVLEVQGAWHEAETTYGEALAVCTEAGDDVSAARVHTELAEVARKQGRFEEAAVRLGQARALTQDEVVLARVLHLEGTLASQQARVDEARAAYGASLVLRERQGDRVAVGALLSNLAVVAEQEGDLDEALRLGQQALAVREEVGDPSALCRSHNNLGMVALLQQDFPRAQGHVREAVRLAQLVGDLWMVAVGAHNLANALLGLGQPAEAGGQFAEALGTYAERDDRWSLALLVEDVVLLALRTGRPVEALRLAGAADALRAALEAPRAPAAGQALEQALAPARAAVPDPDVEVAAGRALDDAAVHALVRAVCRLSPV